MTSRGLTRSTTRPVARRPTSAAAVVALTARAAPPAARTGVTSATRCVRTPTWAARPRAKGADTLQKRHVRSASPRGPGSAAAAGPCRGTRGASPSGPSPSSAGLRRMTAPARTSSTTSATRAATAERPGEAEPGDEQDERRHDEHAAEGGPVEGDAHGQPPAPLPPRRQDDVDRRAAHGAPAHRHHEEGRVEMPRPGDQAERDDAGGHREAAAGHDHAGTETLVHAADRHRQQCAGHVVHRDRRRHRRRRPAVQPLERRHVDGDPVEPEAEAEQGHREGGGHDAPAVEDPCAHRAHEATGAAAGCLAAFGRHRPPAPARERSAC